MSRLLRTLTLLAAVGCLPAPVVDDAPAEWLQPSVIPEAPVDPDDPMARMVWMMQYDNRDFDRTWAFLNDEATPSAQRDLAIGTAGLLGAFELSRDDVIDPAVAALERASDANPSDARLPLWRAFLLWKQVFLAEPVDDVALEAAYEELRRTGVDYPGFTLFGLTLAIAADPHGEPTRYDEGVDAYDVIFEDTFGYQLGDQGERARRLGDWEHAPYNVPGTNALTGDMLLMAGDIEGAEQAYFSALNTNLAYQWPFRDLVDARLQNVEEARLGLLADPPTTPAFGAGWVGARAIDAQVDADGYGGRIGNGTCTVCHTALTAFDADAPVVSPQEVGWVRFRYERPEGVDTPFPVFFGLDDPEPENPPAGIGAGQLLVGDRSSEEDGIFTTVLAVQPGRWFVAGSTRGGLASPETEWSTYMPNALGAPRYLDVEAGRITDVSESPPLRWTVE